MTAGVGGAAPGRDTGAVATIGGFMLVFVVAQLAGALGVGGLLLLGGYSLSSISSTGFDAIVAEVVADKRLLTVAEFAAAPTQVAVVFLLLGGRTRDALGLSPPSWRWIGIGAAAVVALTAAADAASFLMGRSIVSDFQVETWRAATSGGWAWAMWIAFAVLAPVSEEVVFRGYLFAGLRRAWGPWAAVAVVTAAWTLMHVQYDPIGMAQVACVGLMLAWVRIATGGVVLPIAMHALWNAIGTVETALVASGGM